MRSVLLVVSWLVVEFTIAATMFAAEPLPGTAPLEMEGDIASQLVDGVDRFLLRKIDEAAAERDRRWRDKPLALDARRDRLARMLGVRDPRIPFDALELISTTKESSLKGSGEGYEIHAVRWPAFGDVHGEGLLLVPTAGRVEGHVIVIPDCEQTPEQLAGLVEDVPAELQTARVLAENGFRVIVPSLINRHQGEAKVPGMGDRGKGLTNREFLHRSAFELGRTVTGYEVQKVLACVDWFSSDESSASKIGVFGQGEGAAIALYAAAIDPRIQFVAAEGYFGNRDSIWKQPLDRNVFGLLSEFGDAELVAMIAPRAIFVSKHSSPTGVFSGAGGGAPAELVPATDEEYEREAARFEALRGDRTPLFAHAPSTRPLVGEFMTAFGTQPKQKPGSSPQAVGALPDAKARHERQMHEIDRHNQWLLRESEHIRKRFMDKLDPSSLENYAASTESYRVLFSEEVIGRFHDPLLPANPRTRKAYDKETWSGYEVVLDVFPDVIAYGVLLVPKDLHEGERRPVVVCQHGLEGRPQDVIEGDQGAYHDYAAKLCERGFIVFAPQNLYIFEDRFRTLQRKANPLGKTLFSVIVPQHQQITDWLKTLPFVDSERIGFYGLSYGGKSAMRIPALVKNYCLSICSADFNEWVWKNASTRSEYSYVWSGEYEIFEWDLGSTFNYAEMAALIAPRPFMVERGHFDGVAPDEAVAYEYAKVRNLYAAKLGIADRTEIEFFVGPHTINGKGTFDFLHRHLNWPAPTVTAE
jgi:dienelactone hydrolase